MTRPQGPAVTEHGVFVEILGLGLWIEGPAGVGKSQLALELLSRGHRLVADDAIRFSVEPDGELIGSALPGPRGFMEVRGLGLINVGRLFGTQALAADARLDLVLALSREAPPLGPEARLHGPRHTRVILGRPILGLTLPAGTGHNLTVLAETLCRQLLLSREGYDAVADFSAQQRARASTP